MPAVDVFATRYQPQASLSMPPENAGAIVPNDSNDLPVVTRAIYVGVTGDITVHMVGAAPGSNVLLKNAQAGSMLPVRVDRVLQTGTNATNLIALW